MSKYMLALVLLVSSTVFAEPRIRPVSWSKPIIGLRLDNMYLVDKGLYRSEQPQREDVDSLKSLGIKEVLNLRELHSDNDDITDTKLKLHRVKINTGNITENQIIDSLRIISNRKGPILVHCWHGSDRTGVTIAAYRMVFNNWSKSAALDEMVNGGYGYHAKVYPQLVDLVEGLDVARIRKSLGLSKAP